MICISCEESIEDGRGWEYVDGIRCDPCDIVYTARNLTETEFEKLLEMLLKIRDPRAEEGT